MACTDTGRRALGTGRQKELRERRGLERLAHPHSGEVSLGLDSGHWVVGGRDEDLAPQLSVFRPNTTKHLAMMDQLKPQMEPCPPGIIHVTLDKSINLHTSVKRGKPSNLLGFAVSIK